jgi:hypothetical protein
VILGPRTESSTDPTPGRIASVLSAASDRNVRKMRLKKKEEFQEMLFNQKLLSFRLFSKTPEA